MSQPNDNQPVAQHPFDIFGLLNLALPDECVSGVEANMELMQVHARIVEAFDLSKAKVKAADE